MLGVSMLLQRGGSLSFFHHQNEWETTFETILGSLLPKRFRVVMSEWWAFRLTAVVGVSPGLPRIVALGY